MKKICESLRDHGKNIIDFDKKKNVTVNKRKTKITSRLKSILYLRKNNLKKNLIMVKILEKLGVIVSLQINIEAKYMVLVT